MMENQIRQIVVKKNIGELTLEVRYDNVVYIDGETGVYSDIEGCISCVRYSGEIRVYLDETGRVTNFDEINLSINSEYDGWDDQELYENILEDLQDDVLFELILV
ncbi:hypothetical protein DDV21_005380 [Streptococcus chenjunshii]|uniref:Uncharacterized protein n=1 Tax=Streptococcus chenjunshii TaxID=2173853 RepID=A0A372KPE0_9STRE|nr:hypothetical protein [Streptococcus chenjunshii]AXQ78553.1 hypothetical protein DDV21_005380 [Streptococcus chenjunshii]RFU51985.1 hypothetical protein DDV22_00665 [Streptococcus chenjunshii]RFU54177.1 hypothetical protein DDV23_01220 [Streptococcus chenjunshii]